MTRVGSCLGLFAGVSLAVALPVPRKSHGSQASSCLVLSAGAWSPDYHGAMWPRTRSITLTSQSVPNFDRVGKRTGWRAVVIEQGRTGRSARETPELDRAWLWTAPTPDSLVMLRPAMLSEGMSVVGVWVGDT